MSDVVKFEPGSRKTSLSNSDAQDAPAFSVLDLTSGAISLDRPHLLQDDLSDSVSLHPAPLQDWSNQELASLYRVCRILNLAGRPTTTDRGVTDEGDPWFVFVDSQDRVFVHICRIDGRYMIDSPSQTAPVWGNSLTDLTDAFARQNQEAEDAARRAGIVQLVNRANPGHAADDRDQAGGQDIIRHAGLMQDGNILMHPGAALAALIWSIALTSEEQVQPQLPDDDLSTALELGLRSEDGDPKSDLMDPFAGELAAFREAQTANGTLNILSIGLNALAISFGLSMWPQPATPPVLQDLTFVDAATTPEEETDFADSSVALDQDLILKALLLIDSEDLTDQSRIFEGRDIDLDALAADAPMMLLEGIRVALAVLDDLDVLTASLLEDTVAEQDFPHPFNPDIPTDSVETVDGLPVEAVKNSLPTILESSSTITLSALAASTQDAGLDNWLDNVGQFFEGAMVSVVNQASLDQLFLADTDTITTTDVPQDAYQSFDDTAKAFLFNFLRGKDTPVKSVSLATETIIFVDSSAMDNSETFYAKSWSLDNGRVITAIGLQSDFEAFGLVA